MASEPTAVRDRRRRPVCLCRARPCGGQESARPKPAGRGAPKAGLLSGRPRRPVCGCCRRCQWTGPSVTPSAVNEFVETALLSVRRLVLIEEAQFRFVEFFEELAPGQHVQGPVLRIEIQPQDAGIVRAVGGAHGGGLAAALFRPAADGVVVAGGLGFRHHGPPKRKAPPALSARSGRRRTDYCQSRLTL